MLAITSLGTGAGLDQNGPVQLYVFLDKIQCDVKFVARTFQVSVDTNQQAIQVDDVRAADESALDPSLADFGAGLGIIPQRALTQTGLLPFMYTSLFTSVVGNVFATNVQNAYQSNNISVTDFSNTDVNLSGVAQTFESMLDDMLLGLSSAQLMLVPDGTIIVPAQATINSVQIGNAIYIYSITALNFVIAAIFALEAFRHRGWRQLRRFNYSNLAHVAAASSLGGSALGNLMSEKYGSWDAYAANQAAGSTRVQLSETKGGIALAVTDTFAMNKVAFGTAQSVEKENVPLVRMSSKRTFDEDD